MTDSRLGPVGALSLGLWMALRALGVATKVPGETGAWSILFNCA